MLKAGLTFGLRDVNIPGSNWMANCLYWSKHRCPPSPGSSEFTCSCWLFGSFPLPSPLQTYLLEPKLWPPWTRALTSSNFPSLVQGWILCFAKYTIRSLTPQRFSFWGHFYLKLRAGVWRPWFTWQVGNPWYRHTSWNLSSHSRGYLASAPWSLLTSLATCSLRNQSHAYAWTHEAWNWPQAKPGSELMDEINQGFWVSDFLTLMSACYFFSGQPPCVPPALCLYLESPEIHFVQCCPGPNSNPVDHVTCQCSFHHY